MKEITQCRWKHAGGDRTLRLIIDRPLGYRLRKGAKSYYRGPAYLITTNLTMILEQILFRDEKTLLGLGEAQVRTQRYIETLNPFLAAVYAMLILAVEKVGGQSRSLPPPKWQRPHSDNHERISTEQAICELRAEIWSKGLGLPNKIGFMIAESASMKPPKIEHCARSAVFYTTG